MTQMQTYVNEAVSIINESVEDGDGFLWTGGSEAQVLADMLLRSCTDVHFLTVETGNQLDSVRNFRQSFADAHDFEWHVRRNDRVLNIIEDEDDDRGYHGTGSWTIEESCGALKTEPIRDFIQADGYEALVTGMKRNDPTVPDNLVEVVDRREPAHHTRVNPLYNWSEEHVWAYIKREFVPYPDCYDDGYRHTDSVCCMSDDDVSEHDAEGFDQDLQDRRDELQAMGYV